MKKIFCLISIALLLTACSSDSTDTAVQPSSPAAKPVEETVQKVTDAAQQVVDQAANKAQELKNDAQEGVKKASDAVAAKAEELDAEARQLAQQGGDKLAALASSTSSFNNGSVIYQQSCRSCHESGLMGAPKLGNDRFGADIEVLVENSIKGIGRMPARGGNKSLSDADVRAAVMYMVEQSK